MNVAFSNNKPNQNLQPPAMISVPTSPATDATVVKILAHYVFGITDRKYVSNAIAIPVPAAPVNAFVSFAPSTPQNDVCPNLQTIAKIQ